MRCSIDKTVMDEAVFSYGLLWHSIMKETLKHDAFEIHGFFNDLSYIPDDLPLLLFVKNRQSRG